jgi:predicted MFS family arabinose efflux permease
MTERTANPSHADVASAAASTPLGRLAHAWSALRHRDFRWLFVGTFVSNAGSWMQKVATSWLIYQMTGSEAWLGLDAFASGFTTVVLLPWGGVVADRFDRRKLLIWTNVLSSMLAFGLAALRGTGLLHVWHIVAFSAMNGVLQSVMSPASTSLLPAVVGEKDVPNAIALNSLQFNLSRVVGPAAGGATLIYLGAAWSFALNAVSFLVLAVAFLVIRRVPPVKAKKESVIQSVKAGLTFVRHNAVVATMLLLVSMTALLGAPVVSLLPPLVKSVLHREASSYSLLLSCFGGGAVVAAVVSALLGKGPMPWLALPALMVLGGGQVSLAFGGHFVWAAGLVTVAGFAFVGTMIRLGTAILMMTPDDFRGRVSSLQQICFRAGQPLGALLAGVVAQHLGIRAAFWTFGGVLLVAITALGMFGPTLRTPKVEQPAS